jgi:alcohol dehydrogenase class IV
VAPALISCYTAEVVPFRLDLPAAVLFGPGTLAELPAIARRRGRRVFLLTGASWLERSGRLSSMREAFGGAVIEHCACPASEPTTGSVEEARRRARAFRPQVIVAVGGGSVLDTAKALSGVLGVEEPVERFLEGIGGSLEIPGPGVPWIAVPTTAGTGAEVTRNAVLRLPDRGLKRSLRSSFLLAASVIVDPELTLTLPPEVTGTGGLDALTQLVEAHVARKRNSFTSSLVRGAFLPLLDALERLPENPADIGLRTAASYGAFVSGIALANAGLGAAHGFAAGLGGMYDIPHGLLCAVFLPHVLEANADVIHDRVAELAGGRNGQADPVQWLADVVRRLLRCYGLPIDLHAFGVPANRVPEIVERSAGSSMRGNPRDLGRAEQERIVRLAIGSDA